jgi:rhodanese-related sulfurtransferase
LLRHRHPVVPRRDHRRSRRGQEGPARAHIKDAVLINFSGNDFNEKIRQLDKSKTYLVHCASGIRSVKACAKLEALEFPRLVNLEGGMKAWEKAGKLVEK